MPGEYLTVYSEFFRWILRETQNNLEPMALYEFLKKYTTDETLQLKLKNFSSHMFSRMQKLEGFTVLQKVQILFLVNKTPCKPFRNQMWKAGKFKLNCLGQIQWFRSKDGTFKLERQEEPFRTSLNLQGASQFFRFVISKGNSRIPTSLNKAILRFLSRRNRPKYIEESVYSILNEGNLIEGFSLFESVTIFFLCSRPISEVFEEKIKEAGRYTLDKNRRITYFRSNDGSFEREDIWRNNDQELQEGEDDKEEGFEDEMRDDSEQSNNRQDLEHEELDPEPMEGMESDPANESTIQRGQGRSQRDCELEAFELEHREPTIQLVNRQENGQVYLAPEPISNEPLEPAQMAQNELEVMPVFVKLAAPKDHVVKQELPEDLNQILVKEEFEEQEVKPTKIESPTAKKVLTLVRNMIWAINSPTLEELLGTVQEEMENPEKENVKIAMADIESAVLLALGNIFKSASSTLSPNTEPFELKDILMMFKIQLSMLGLKQECPTILKIRDFIESAGDKEVTMTKIKFALDCMAQTAI